MWPLTLSHDPWLWTLPVRRPNETWNHIFDLVTLTSDIGLQVDLWPWPQRLPVIWSNETWNNVSFLPGDLDLWPMTSTLKVNLRVILVNALTKFHDPKSNTFGLVTFGKKLFFFVEMLLSIPSSFLSQKYIFHHKIQLPVSYRSQLSGFSSFLRSILLCLQANLPTLPRW